MNELYHHGIKGQQWGVQNGPPYPLDSDDKSSAEKKASGGKEYSDRKKARLDKRRERVIKRAEVYTKQTNKQLDRSTKKAQRRGDKRTIATNTVTKLQANKDFESFLNYYSQAPYEEIVKDRAYERGKVFLSSLKGGGMGAGVSAAGAVVGGVLGAALPGAQVASLVVAPQLAAKMANKTLDEINNYYLDKGRKQSYD